MKCKKCQSENLIMRTNAKNPNATEVICGDCGAWQKFIGKDEIRLFEIRTSAQPKIPTNADRIRAMNDEELAKALHQAYADGMCDMVRAQRDIGTHVNTIMYYRNWLQQPAKEEV